MDINQYSSTPKAPKAQNSLVSISHFLRLMPFAKQAFIRASSGLILLLHVILQPQVEQLQPNHVEFSYKNIKSCSPWRSEFFSAPADRQWRIVGQLQVWNVELCECEAGWVYKKHGGLSAWPCERFKIYLQVNFFPTIFYLNQSGEFPHWHRLQQREVTQKLKLYILQLENQSNHTCIPS